MGFCRNSIPKYAELSFELQELINKTDPGRKGHSRFRFTELHQTLFDKMKRAAEQYLPLYEIDPAKPLYAFSDASKRSVAFVAFQLEGPDVLEPIPAGEATDDLNVDRTRSLMDKIFNPLVPTKQFAFCFSRKLTAAEGNIRSSSSN